MQPGRPSRTAQHNALFRALEQRLPGPLFRDPWARRFLRGRYRLVAMLPARLVAAAIDARWPGPRAAVAVRTRYIDDAIRQAVTAGLDQLVLLGAGFDSRAWRLPELAPVHVFEVDHPRTQELKRSVVGASPGPLTWAAADLARDPLAEALRSAGVRSDVRTLVVWEGVSNYLDDASVDRTLRVAESLAQAILFTYVDAALLRTPGRFQGAAESLAYVRTLGEPFTFGLDPAAVPAYLAARGWAVVEDVPLSALGPRYYGAAPPPISTYYRVVDARRSGPGPRLD